MKNLIKNSPTAWIIAAIALFTSVLACKKIPIEPGGIQVITENRKPCENQKMDFDLGERGIDCGGECYECYKKDFGCISSGTNIVEDGNFTYSGNVKHEMIGGQLHLTLADGIDTLRVVFPTKTPIGNELHYSETKEEYADGVIPEYKTQLTFYRGFDGRLYYGEKYVYFFYETIDGVEHYRVEFCDVLFKDENFNTKVLSGSLTIVL